MTGLRGISIVDDGSADLGAVEPLWRELFEHHRAVADWSEGRVAVRCEPRPGPGPAPFWSG